MAARREDRGAHRRRVGAGGTGRSTSSSPCAGMATSRSSRWTACTRISSSACRPSSRTAGRAQDRRVVSADKGAASGNPSASGGADRHLPGSPASQRPQALSAGADARAVVPLQPGLRRLRQDRLSRRDPRSSGCPTTTAWTRSTNAARPSCRSPAASRCCTVRCRRSSKGYPGAQEVRDPVHQRPAAGQEDRRLQAASLLHLVDPPRWQPGDARQVGLPAGHLRQGGRGDPAGQGEGLPRQHQLHAVQRRRSRARSPPSSTR